MKFTFKDEDKIDIPKIPRYSLKNSSGILIFVLLLLGLAVNTCLAQKSGVLNPFASDNNATKENKEILDPTVFIAVLVRNKAHTLPYFLTLLDKLDYPKDRIALWMRSDHNEDATPDILRSWSREVEDWGKYHSVSVEIVDSPPYRQSDQNISMVQWTTRRFRHIIRLKEEALRVARKVWSDYIWFLDADAFIVNNQTLRHLVSLKKGLVAPMLLSGGMYSNFWGGMENYYYVRTDEYKEILDMKKMGCFPVPMIHTAILMDLRTKNMPNFVRTNQSIPEDDIILLAENARERNVTMEICNDLEYGFVLSPLDENQDVSMDYEQIVNLRVEIAAYWPNPLEASNDLQKWLPRPPTPNTIGFDQVYLINLKRRSDRLIKMQNVLQILGIEYEVIDAVDGSELTPDDVEKLEIRQLPDYRDPYSKRLMTYGEIGCFLSHYKIWQTMVKHRVSTALVLEDDIRFEPYFVYQVKRLFEEAAHLFLDWDLMYLGRKRSANANEPWVEGSNYMVNVDYSYWTLGYGLTLRGAKKLIDAKPFEKLVPVDEYLPIMFNRHVKLNASESWKLAYPNRDLKAYSAEPLLLYPTHYTGEAGYISDTEKSRVIIKANCTIKDEL